MKFNGVAFYKALTESGHDQGSFDNCICRFSTGCD
jgi:hypothetical protein